MQSVRSGVLAVGLLLAAVSAKAQHLNAGAIGQNQNDALTWANGAALAASSGYAKELTFTNAGPYAGFYQGSITLTALSSTNGGPAPGAFAQAKVVSLQGPDGGQFGFWEEDATEPTFVINSGTTGANFMFALSDAEAGAGTPGADAFGHLHGRRFSVNLPGEYLVGFQAVDTSSNGAGGGAIHSASDVLFVKFFAVPEPATLALVAVGAGALLLTRNRRQDARR